MNPTLEQLAQYVMQELARGVPEVTLYNDLQRAGWTAEWINGAFSAAKQHIMPPTEGQLHIPPVQVSPADLSPVLPAARPRKRFTPHFQSAPHRLPKLQKPTIDLKKTLIVLIIFLAAILAGLSAYRFLSNMEKNAEARMSRDAVRRQDLAVLLSDLSDYFVAQGKYPTLQQMQDPAFLSQNGFQKESVSDPLWTPDVKACTKTGQPRLAARPAQGCYGYAVLSAKNTNCNNSGIPCIRASAGIMLEKDKKGYTVLFDKNREIETKQ